MKIERVTQPGEEWDRFAESMPGVCLGHAAAWASILRESYGLEPCYLEARNADGDLAGILPLTEFRTLRGGRELISLPYLDAAGILARDDETARALRHAALELCRSRPARALELRQTAPLADQPHDEAVPRVNLVLPLQQDVDAQWKALSAKVRNQTRKAERQDLVLAEGTHDELLLAFYEPFQVNMRDLGSPVHGLSFFRSASRHLGERLRFVVTRLGSRPVGGLVAIRYGRSVTVPWASTLRSERKRCPNNLIYWEALRWAVLQGATKFDFGRSPQGSGTHRFKLGWGAGEEPLAWVRLDSAGNVKPMTVGSQSGAMTRASEIWTRLPVPVAGVIGPRLRRYFSN